MSILTTLFSSKSKVLSVLLITVTIGWMAMYPIYRNYYNGLGMEQYERFKDFKAHNSMFFNPWQYRILCPYMVEGIYQVLDHTVFQLADFSKISINPPQNSGEKNPVTQKLIEQSGNGEFFKYNIVFVLFRFAQHIAIFYLAFRYFSSFTKNRALVFFGVMLIALFMGNAVADSDLSFNTYMDVILYLGLGIVIMESLSGWWVVALTFIGAFNRETSLLIPFIYLVSKLNFAHWPNVFKVLFSDKKAFWQTVLSGVLFIIIFVSIRAYFGYRPPTVWRVPAGLPMLKLNLLSSVSVKTYMEMFGIFGILPVWILSGFRKTNYYLRVFFLALVPIWFGIHLWSVVAYQSRLFLVPTLLVFIPAILERIELHFKERPSEDLSAA